MSTAPNVTAYYAQPMVARIATLLAGVALIAIGGYYCLHGKLNADEGFYLLASRLVSEGFRPYADFGFTQTPLIAYVNLPWLSLFGFSLAGIRLAGLAWALLAVSLGCIVLRRNAGWFAAFTFCFLLLASPGWLAFCVKGKTYAFTSLSVLIGTVALVSRGDARVRWAIFTIVAAAGVSARLPLFPFFAVGWLFFLFENHRWQDRLIGSMATLVLAGGCLWLAAAGEWTSFRFWVLDFHLASEIGRNLAARVPNAFELAPGTWILLLLATASFRLSGNRFRWLAPQIAIWLCLATSILPATGYGEYVTPMIPAAALVVSSQLATRMPPYRKATMMCTLVFVMGAGWLNSPPLEKGILENAVDAENFLRHHVPVEFAVVASMPEIPASTGHRVAMVLAPGKFSVTEDFDDAQASTLRMATPRKIGENIHAPETGALVFSLSPRWNFGWSLPSYRPLSGQGTSAIFAKISEDFELAFENRDYVIFLRKEILDSADGLD